MSVQQNAGVVLPAACAVAASFDPALARSVGAAQGQAEVDPNIKRSPLCGRNFAMFSEDPHLTAALAAAVVGGAQNAVVGPLLCCSQVTDAPDRRVDERTLQEIYLPPAAASLQAGPQGVRYGSGTLNGVPLAEAAAALLPQPAAKTNDTPSTAPTRWRCSWPRSAACWCRIWAHCRSEPGSGWRTSARLPRPRAIMARVSPAPRPSVRWTPRC